MSRFVRILLQLLMYPEKRFCNYGLCASIIVLICKTASCAPEIVFDRRNLHLGTVSQNQHLQWAFAFSNAGDEDLIIERIASSCACVISQKNGIRSSPGQSKTISGEIRADSKPGDHKYHIHVTTNDPEVKKVILTLAFSVSPYLIIAPSKLFFFNTLNSKSVTFFLPGTRLRVAECAIDGSEAFYCERQSCRENADADRVVVGVKPSSPPGVYRGSVLVRFEDDTRSFSVPLLAKVRAKCFVGGSGGRLGRVEHGKKVIENLPLYLYHTGNDTPDEYRISVRRVSDPALSAKLKTGSMRALEVSFHGTEPGVYNGHIALDLEKPSGSHEEVLIPITAIVVAGE